MAETTLATGQQADARWWLRAEGGVILLLSLLLYRVAGGGWLLFLLLLLLPDISMAGYALGARAGARIYNIAHSYVLPLALGGVGIVVDRQMLVLVAIIWAAHIGMDRLFGFGLKLPTGFRDTHLGPIGRGA